MKTEVLRLRITPELKDEVKSSAEREGKTLSSWIENLIKTELEKQKTSPAD